MPCTNHVDYVAMLYEIQWNSGKQSISFRLRIDDRQIRSVRTENKGLLALFSVRQMRWIAYNFKSEITGTGSLSAISSIV